MLQHIWQLKQEGRWEEIRQLAPAFLDRCGGEQRAWLHLVLGKAYEETATRGSEYHQALRHARLSVASSEPGSLIHAWALQMVAGHAADLGAVDQAECAAKTFFEALPHHPSAQSVAPYAMFALGRSLHYKGSYAAAIACFDQVLAHADPSELSERVALFRVWSLAQSGRVADAVRSLPSSVRYVSSGHLSAAKAVLHSALGEWNEARQHASAALKRYDAGDWRLYDTIQAAELYLILKNAALRTGQSVRASEWHRKVAALLACWNAAILTRLVLMLQGRGGDTPHAAATRVARGPAGNHRWALTGTVG